MGKYSILLQAINDMFFFKDRRKILHKLRATIPDKSLGTLAHFSSICQGNLSGHPPPPNSMLFIVMKIVIARFQHCRGGRGFLIPVMPLVIFSKIAYQRIFQLFDPGVPRTFVGDCICVTRRDYDMFSGKIRKKAPCFV